MNTKLTYEIEAVRGGIREIVAHSLSYREAMQQAPIIASSLDWRGDTSVYVSWHRSSDGQNGHLDQDGSHVITGHAWRPEIIAITRKNRNIGFGWTTATSQTPTCLDVQEVDAPDYTGTVKTVLDQINSDANYQSLGGTCHRDQWFAKISGEWRKINFLDSPHDLYNTGWVGGDKYLANSVDAKIVG